MNVSTTHDTDCHDKPTLNDKRLDEITHLSDLRLAAAHRITELLATLQLASQILGDGDAAYAKRIVDSTLEKHDTPDITLDAASTATRRHGDRRRQDPAEWVHGTLSTYQYRKCKCDPCRAAGAAANKAAIERRNARRAEAREVADRQRNERLWGQS